MQFIVPRTWQNETVVIIAGGPSLTEEDVEYCRGKAKIIGINDAYRICDFLDLLYACDAKWLRWHAGVSDYQGIKITQHKAAANDFNWWWIHGKHSYGLSEDPKTIHYGSNSGYQALNIAFLTGAKKILLLGYDMKRGGNNRTHWFGEHPNRSGLPFKLFIEKFKTVRQQLIDHGVKVINCSRATALPVFDIKKIQDCL